MRALLALIYFILSFQIFGATTHTYNGTIKATAFIGDGSGLTGIAGGGDVDGPASSVDSRVAAFDGIAGTANTVSVAAPAGINRLRIGARTSAGTVGAHWDGRIAEVAVFAGLQVSQAVSLSQGVWPFKVAPGSLRNYLPLDNDVYDRTGNLRSWTTTGTTVS